MRDPVIIMEDVVLDACAIAINIYDCNGTDIAFYVTIASTISYALATTYCSFVIGYRLRRRLDMQLTRRIDGYYVPIPLTNLLVLLTLLCANFTLTFALLLFDLPHSWLGRGLWFAFPYIFSLATLLNFTIGIIAHIPTVFIHSPDRTGIKVPPMYLLSRLTLLGMLAVVAVSLGTCLWMGWARGRGNGSQFVLSMQLVYAVMSLFYLAAVFACLYYSRSFYRIVTSHARGSANKHGRQSRRMLEAARRFRNLFLLVLAAGFCGMANTITATAMTKKFFIDFQQNLVYAAPTHVLFLPLIIVGIVHTVLRSSATFNQRDASLQSETAVDSIWDLLSSGVKPEDLEEHQQQQLRQMLQSQQLVTDKHSQIPEEIPLTRRYALEENSMDKITTVSIRTASVTGQENDSSNHNGGQYSRVDHPTHAAADETRIHLQNAGRI